MKRTLIIELLLFFIFGVIFSVVIINTQNIIQSVNWYKNNLTNYPWQQYVEDIQLPTNIARLVFYYLATISNLIAIILIGLKDFKPLASKYKARKETRAKAKAERAEADKQAKIQALKSELEKLENE